MGTDKAGIALRFGVVREAVRFPIIAQSYHRIAGMKRAPPLPATHPRVLPRNSSCEFRAQQAAHERAPPETHDRSPPASPRNPRRENDAPTTQPTSFGFSNDKPPTLKPALNAALLIHNNQFRALSPPPASSLHVLPLNACHQFRDKQAANDRAPPSLRTPAPRNSYRSRNDKPPATKPAPCFSTALLLSLLCLASHPADAQTLGGACTVTGSLAEAQANPAYLLVCNGTTWQLGEQINSNGQVGIGQTSIHAALDVNGGVRVGTDATCAAANAGEIIYTGGNVEYCNGTSWITLITGNPGSGTIGGTSGVLVELTAGSAAAPSLTFYADTQTGIYQPAASTMAVTTAGTERAVFDGSGNFNLLGTTAAYEIDSNKILAVPAADTVGSLAVGIGVLTSGSLSGLNNTG